MSGRNSEDAQAREARLAEALRANLRRRKAQSRGRREDASGPGAPPDEACERPRKDGDDGETGGTA